ncbi:hypothetical protein HZA75_03360 [Candidatus Roizmanbacteria bacterium]|nr:hypothetical protein [Candidatus Roizmanbacteria bacterium]
MNFLLIPLLFLIWRIFDFLIIFFSQKIIPYLGFFPYKDQLPGFNLPNWISALANFDGLHYISIARDGYAQYEQAFFPLYPLSIKFLTPIFLNNQLLTGIIISNISFLIGLIVFNKYLHEVQTPNLGVSTTVLLLLAFPTSFFFGAVYTEGLFFLLLISTLYFLKKERYLLVAIFAFLASLTRLVGVFLIIPIFFHLIKKSKVKSQNYNLKVKSLLILSPLLGLGLYCFYLFKTTGDPFFFLTSQPIFGANRSSHLIFLPQVYWRYLKIFFTANWNFQYFSSLIEFFVFNFVFIILVLDLFKNLIPPKAGRNYDLLALNIFSFSNLILPTLTGTFSSIPRYSLFSLSFFLYLSQLKNNLIKYFILVIFLVLHILLLGYYTQGYFIS